MFPLWLIQLIVVILLNTAAYLLAPRPKTSKSNPRQMDSPTADAGKEIPIIFGTITVKEPNCLGYWDKQYFTFEVSA